SADESELLGDVLRRLVAAAADGGGAGAGAADSTDAWLEATRASQLADVMTSGLVDIVRRYASRKLDAWFDAARVRRLVLALFEDSALRRKQLAIVDGAS